MRVITWNHNMPGLMRFIPPDDTELRGRMVHITEEGDKVPRRRPGDRYPLFFALLGAIIGLLIGIKAGMPLWPFIGAIVGGVIGTILGSLLGSYVLNRHKSRNARTDN